MRRLVVLALSVFAVVIYAACGSDATGIDECRQIETARCQAAPACLDTVSLAMPPHVGSDVDGCINFYNDACLHGLEVADPGAPAVAACIKAIQLAGQKAPNTSCFTIAHPETNAACSWLVAPVTPVDASVDDADDGSTVDAADAADAD
jgi:hypothetical protein